MDTFTSVIEAHKKSDNHKAEIMKSELCGCFYCLAIYPPSKIEKWIDEEKTAVCPECAIDSVIGSESGFPITREFLQEMHNYWF